MLKRHSQFFLSLLFIADLAFISVAWFLAYGLRFHTDFIPVTKGIPPFNLYLVLLPPILIVWGVVFKLFNLYRPRRISSYILEAWDITKASSLAGLIVVSFSFFLRQFEYSRIVFVMFWCICIILVTVSRWSFREILRSLRRRGYNLRYSVIVGAGSLGRELASKVHQHRELGIIITGFLTRKPDKVGQDLDGIKILGTYSDLPRILKTHQVDQVFLALPRDAYVEAERIHRFLHNQTVDVRIVPDLFQFMSIGNEAEIFEGMPIVTVQASPLYGWMQILKRGMDIVFSSLILILAFPLMLLIGLVIKLTSPGQILYHQNRIGYDGRSFKMLKFRTMRQDAEKDTGVVWTTKDDPRRTLVGGFLRKTSLDELPQFSALTA